jgi:hypothetical protein
MAAAAAASGGWADVAALPAPATAALLAALFLGAGCGGPPPAAAAAAAELAPQARVQPMPAPMARATSASVAGRLAGGRALPAAPSVVADVADGGGLFGLVAGAGEEAGAEAAAEVEPFTMYGNNFKKYSIEVLKGDKARLRRGGAHMNGNREAAAATHNVRSFPRSLPAAAALRCA